MNRNPHASHCAAPRRRTKLIPSDEQFMRHALCLAKRGLGRTHPNPAVGCVLVRGSKIIGEGWHRRAGGPHAEVAALRCLKHKRMAKGATAYVTLEPCSTHGLTPPCTSALIEAGIRRVVVGAIDPNPAHRGRGLALLRSKGIRITSGVLESECIDLNPEFHHFMSTGRPWVIAKCGMSLDGRLTRPKGESRWITSPAARTDAMKLRAAVDAILVGAGTIRDDDPALTVRGAGKRQTQPIRVVWAPRCAPAANARVFNDAHSGSTLILPQKSLGAALRKLGARGIRRVLIEGGGYTLGCAFGQHLAQEIVFYIAPLLAGGRVTALGRSAAASSGSTLRRVQFRKLGQCLRISATVNR